MLKALDTRTIAFFLPATEMNKEIAEGNKKSPLNNSTPVQVMADPEWTHLGFIWFMDAGKVLYPHMADMMEGIDRERQEEAVARNSLGQR